MRQAGHKPGKKTKGDGEMKGFKKSYNIWIVTEQCGKSFPSFTVEERIENKKPVFFCHYWEIFRSNIKMYDGQHEEHLKKIYDKQAALDLVLTKYNLYKANKSA